MKVAMISPEIVPFAKTGGLADVVGTLSVALGSIGHQLTLIMPAYRAVLQGGFALEETGMHLSLPLGDRQEEAAVLRTASAPNVSVFCIRADRYFDRDFLYGTAAEDYPDNAERFVFFCRAALEILRRQSIEVLHCHDWQSAPAIIFLKAQPERYAPLRETKTVFTVHNLGFQGIFQPAYWPLLDLDWSLFTPRYLEFYGNINFLKGALVFADKITTVSPSYAREILEADQGFGLEGVLRERERDIVGILNGVDYSQWSPQNDPYIARTYEANNLAAKQTCKKSLQRSLALPQRSELPLIGMISRLTSQKGLDLVEVILDELMQSELQMAVLGSGEARYEALFTAAAARYPHKIAARIGFDEALAHQIEAGADFFLMPSHYEPCGLNQMFSLKYGTIPIVRAVGGLKDTVEDYDEAHGSGTGFVFAPYEPDALAAAIHRGLRAFRNKRAWTALRRRAMAKDFSWDRSAELYSDLYKNLLSGESRPDRGL
jgi:starch synthase